MADVELSLFTPEGSGQRRMTEIMREAFRQRKMDLVRRIMEGRVSEMRAMDEIGMGAAHKFSRKGLRTELMEKLKLKNGSSSD